MPTRQKTRAAARTQAIHTERALNDTHVAQRNMPRRSELPPPLLRTGTTRSGPG
ncbi:MAG TPA: hypothetical protein VMU34_04700 [Mycobacterium sp.]|nr:hypothetical protein [Mycobacterium sp.]